MGQARTSILIAPDKFKGTLTAESAASSISAAVASRLPEARIEIVPLSDGGEGFAASMLRYLGGGTTRISVTGPSGAEAPADIAFLEDGRAVVEMAQASGLGLMRAPDALRASSFGTGEAISWAATRAPHVLVGVGGSASTDGGTGAARAVGWRFLDAHGRDIPRGGGSLVHLAQVLRPAAMPSLAVTGACDVHNPLLGPDGAAVVFSPQKGADADAVSVLEAGLENLAHRLEEDFGVSVGRRPMTGAGGGMAAGLAAFFGADLVDGFDVMAEATRLRELIGSSDLVITGEGALDASGSKGKVPGRLARLCRDMGVPCLVVAGSIASSEAAAGFAAAASLEDAVGLRAALRSPAESLEMATGGLLDVYL